VDAIGLHAARELLLGGEGMTPEWSLASGLACELAPAEKVLERAVARARALCVKTAAAFGAIKRMLIEVAGHGEVGPTGAIWTCLWRHWFSAESVARRQELTASLRS